MKNLFLFISLACVAHSATLSDLNTLTIEYVVIEGVDTFSTTANANKTNTRANLDKIYINNGSGQPLSVIDTSTYTNVVTSTVGSYTPSTLNSDLGVFTGLGGGTRVGYNPSIDNAATESNFLAEVQDSIQSPNLRNYFDFNGVSGGNSATLTFTYQNALNPNGTILIGERDGNSAFTIEALNASDVKIGDTITIGANSPAFAFDTGIAANDDPQPLSQSIELAVFEISLFNTSDDIFSLRFFNDSGADIFVLAPAKEPQVVPEPSAYAALTGLAALALAFSRRPTKSRC